MNNLHLIINKNVCTKNKNVIKIAFKLFADGFNLFHSINSNISKAINSHLLIYNLKACTIREFKIRNCVDYVAIHLTYNS